MVFTSFFYMKYCVSSFTCNSFHFSLSFYTILHHCIFFLCYAVPDRSRTLSDTALFRKASAASQNMCKLSVAPAQTASNRKSCSLFSIFSLYQTHRMKIRGDRGKKHPSSQTPPPPTGEGRVAGFRLRPNWVISRYAIQTSAAMTKFGPGMCM